METSENSVNGFAELKKARARARGVMPPEVWGQFSIMPTNRSPLAAVVSNYVLMFWAAWEDHDYLSALIYLLYPAHRITDYAGFIADDPDTIWAMASFDSTCWWRHDIW